VNTSLRAAPAWVAVLLALVAFGPVVEHLDRPGLGPMDTVPGGSKCFLATTGRVADSAIPAVTPGIAAPECLALFSVVMGGPDVCRV